MKPLVIGQAPGPQTDPDHPLFPNPKNSAGYRLANMSGLTRTQFLRWYDRTNLIRYFPGSDPNQNGDHFPKQEARAAAEMLRPLLLGKRVILLGRNVCDAFGYRVPFFEWCHDQFDFVVVPHTSGASPAYAEQSTRDSLRRVMFRALDPSPIIQGLPCEL